MSISFNWVGAVLATAAAGAVFSAPHAVELLTGSINQCLVVGEDSRLEVAAAAALHAYAGSCQVGGADVGCIEVEYKHFEMDSQAKHPLQSGL